MYHRLQNLFLKGETDLRKAMKGIPPEVTVLDLSANSLDGDNLLTILSSIPSSVERLDLSCNNFGGKEIRKLAEAIARIPLSVTKLCLGGNNLAQKSVANLKILLAAIGQGVTELYLDNNDFWKKRPDDLANILGAMPSSVKKLDLSNNGFHNMEAGGLARAIGAIPPSVTELDLGKNEFHKITDLELASVLAAGKHIRSLGLSWNDFGDRISGLTFAISAIPPNVSFLDLSAINLSKPSVGDLKALLAAIPKGVKELCLRLNQLGFKKAQLAEVFASIPPSVTFLDLRSNCLNILSSADLKIALAALPEGVRTLDLNVNDFDNKTDAQWIQLLSSSPFVHQVIVHNRIINKFELYANQLLAQIEQLLLNDPQALVTSIKPDFEIDEVAMSRIIDILEKKKTSAAYLVCAMLLDYSIQNVMRGEGPENQEKYDEKRSYDAVTFYEKAIKIISSREIQDIVSSKVLKIKESDKLAPSLRQHWGKISSPKNLLLNYSLFHQGILGVSLYHHEQPMSDPVSSDFVL